MADLNTSIVQTLAFFDAFDRPLTREELYRHLWQGDVAYQDFLEQCETVPNTAVTSGFFHLPGRESIVDTHQLRVCLIEQKTAIARRATQKMRWIPFVRAVFLCNTVALGCPKDGSDVDVFIVVKSGRLWFARLLVTIAMSLFRLRRTKKNVANKVCLSFYATETALDLSKIKLFPDDIYLVYWIAHLVPLFDPNHLLKEIEEKNQWMREFFPRFSLKKDLLKARGIQNPTCIRFCRRASEILLTGWLGNTLEQTAKRLQKMKMGKNANSLQNEPDTRVIISDEMLKFHENDRRGYYREEWKKRVKRIVELKN